MGKRGLPVGLDFSTPEQPVPADEGIGLDHHHRHPSIEQPADRGHQPSGSVVGPVRFDLPLLEELQLLPQERKRRNRRKVSTFAGFVVGEDALARSYQGTSGSVEEKSQIQALDRTQPLLAMRPGQVKRRTHDYARHGMTCLFAALDVKTRKIIGEYHRRPTSGATAPCPVVARPGESLPE